MSRRPYLRKRLNEYDINTFEQDLEELQAHLSSMSYLMFDEKLLTTIREKSKLDPVLNSPMLPHVVIYSEKR